MASNRNVTVFGAYGHTGRFVVSELIRRGWLPILSGRDADKLTQLAKTHGGLEVRPASVSDRPSLDKALQGAVAAINCAGPFLDTATAVIEAALKARIHYLDVTPEQQAVQFSFERYADAAKDAGVAVMPAMAFYGGLADLLATAAMGDWAAADEICVATALDSWHPTQGTRLTGKRNTARRLVVANHQLEFLADPSPTREWDFPAPFGSQQVVGLPLAEIITISHHLRSSEVHAYMNLAPLRDIRDPATPPPVATDETGRSSQLFVVDVLVRRGNDLRRATARGRDIYAITAPLIVEAMERLVDGRHKTIGVIAAGEAFDAPAFLAALTPDFLSLEFSSSITGAAQFSSG